MNDPNAAVTIDVPDLWHAYKTTGSLELRNRLAIHYSPLVKYVARRVRSGLPQNVDQGDLVSDGAFGLLDAIEKFQPERGLQFQTYAVPRIRGAIIDGLRASDWVPRSVRNRIRDIDRAQVELQHRLGRTPSDAEVAVELGITVADVRGANARSVVNHVSIEELAALDDLAPELSETPEDDDTRELLMAAVHALPERDRIILALYYFEGLTLGEIGQVLGVTESRVSQLRSRIAATLRDQLAPARAG